MIRRCAAHVEDDQCDPSHSVLSPFQQPDSAATEPGNLGGTSTSDCTGTGGRGPVLSHYPYGGNSTSGYGSSGAGTAAQGLTPWAAVPP